MDNFLFNNLEINNPNDADQHEPPNTNQHQIEKNLHIANENNNAEASNIDDNAFVKLEEIIDNDDEWNQEEKLLEEYRESMDFVDENLENISTNNDANLSNEPKIYEIFYENGNIFKRITLVNNIPDGKTTIFDEYGNISNNLFYKNGALHGKAEFFFNNMPLMFTHYINGVQNGKTELYSNGLMVGEVEVVNGLFEGDFISYNQDGGIVRRAKYSNGRENGECISYFPDGQILEIAEYINGVMNGKVSRYYPNGHIRENVEYQKGKPICVESFDIDGNFVNRKNM